MHASCRNKKKKCCESFKNQSRSENSIRYMQKFPARIKRFSTFLETGLNTPMKSGKLKSICRKKKKKKRKKKKEPHNSMQFNVIPKFFFFSFYDQLILRS